MNISPNWTDAERLSVVGKIAEELLNHPMGKRDEVLFDIQERLRFLSTCSASALEANREDIINGKRVSQPKCNEPQAPPSETHPPCVICEGPNDQADICEKCAREYFEHHSVHRGYTLYVHPTIRDSGSRVCFIKQSGLTIDQVSGATVESALEAGRAWVDRVRARGE